LDVVDDPPQAALKIIVGIDRERSIDVRRAVGSRDQDRKEDSKCDRLDRRARTQEFGYFASGIRWVVVQPGRFFALHNSRAICSKNRQARSLLEAPGYDLTR
jgi:hypothetical protein